MSSAWFGWVLRIEMVNSLTGWGKRNRIVEHHLRWVVSTSHRFVTLMHFTWVSAATTAWRYLAAGESPPLEGPTPIPNEWRDMATSLAVPPNSSSSLAAFSRSV